MARSKLKPKLFRWIRELAFHTPLQRWFFYRYDYMYTPPQLCFLSSRLDAVAEVPGSVVEIGCAFGHTTVFLNKHMDAQGIDKPYWCIDTFRGFTAADVRAEREVRPEAGGDLVGTFRHNSPRWFRRTLENNGVDRVRIVVSDVAEVDFDDLGEIAFCLIDVDLYQPVKVALEKVYPRLSPGGVIVIDDCREGDVFEGARLAYFEFARGLGREPEVRLEKLGILRKP